MGKIPEQRNPRAAGARRADKSFDRALARERGRGGGGGGGMGGGGDWKGGGGCAVVTLALVGGVLSVLGGTGYGVYSLFT